ncbi:MAG: hypothetical protein ACOCRK_06990 [bacterium]
MSKRNKKAGSKCELYFLKKLEKIHKEKLYTTRNISTLRDSQQIDIENESLTLPVKYQVKQSINTPKFSTILSEMKPDDINVILYQKTQKKGNRFYKYDDYVIMTFKDYEKIMSK